MRFAAAWACALLVTVGTADASTLRRSTSPYTSVVVVRAYARAGLALSSEGRHRFGPSARPLYLTLAPATRKAKAGVAIRGADFSVLVFQSASDARSALTARVQAQLHAGREPWVQRANLILVSRVPVLASDAGSLAMWNAARRVVAALR